jgi:hypothetical protein
MSYFLKKDKASCLNEIKAASDHISQIFNAEMNLLKLKEQVDLLIEGKIESYLHQRFKDWSVSDLILLAKTIEHQTELEGKTDQKGRKQRERV